MIMNSVREEAEPRILMINAVPILVLPLTGQCLSTAAAEKIPLIISSTLLKITTMIMMIQVKSNQHKTTTTQTITIIMDTNRLSKRNHKIKKLAMSWTVVTNIDRKMRRRLQVRINTGLKTNTALTLKKLS